MQKTTGMFDTHSIYVRICHNIRIDVNQQHAECDRHQWLKSVFDCQIQEYQRNQDHNIVAPLQVHERSLFP